MAKMNAGSEVDRIVGDLKYAKDKGLDVKVVFEYSSYDSILNLYNSAFRETLETYNILCRMDNPSTTTHAKVVIIDSSYILIGSTNWSMSALEKNHEANIMIFSPVIGKDIETYFQKIWEGE